jgi:hypothetical protein
MVGKMEVEGFVDLFFPFRLLLRAVVVAPTKEARVFHSGSAELSDVMIHADTEGQFFDDHYDTRPPPQGPMQDLKRKAY